jgi:F-type H+-transporting ATPase subunit a
MKLTVKNYLPFPELTPPFSLTYLVNFSPLSMVPRVISTALKTLAVLPLCAVLATTAHAAGGHEAASSLKDVVTWWPLTNSIFTSLLVTTLTVIGIRLLVGTPKLVPSKGQAIFETLVSGLRDILEPIVGKKAMPGAFPLLLCFFVFILVHNYSGLLPLVGTMGWGHTDPESGKFIVDIALLRPHTSEANGTIALALVSFVGWLILIFKYAGPKLIWHDLFGNKATKAELPVAMYYFLSVVFLIVGIIEIISIGIRPISLSARLFGNVFGGETLLHATGFIFAGYFLELIVGLVQAFVFTLLSAVYIGLICNHGDDHGHDEHEHSYGSDEHAPAETAKH